MSTKTGKAVMTKNKQDADRGKPTLASLAREVLDTVPTFPDAEGEAYARIGESVMPMRSSTFLSWLSDQLTSKHPALTISKRTLEDAIFTAISVARQKPPQAVFVRSAYVSNKVFFDCGNNYIEASEDGVKVLPSPAPVNFVRPKGWLPIDMSNSQGNLDDFFSLLNVADSDRVLLWGFLAYVAANGLGVKDFPIVIFSGEQGSGKSMGARLLRQLLDPSKAGLSSPFSSERDLCIMAKYNAILAFDNLDKITAEDSNMLCRLSGGVGLSARMLYTDAELMVFNEARPAILTGITIEAWRGDLASRSISIRLDPIEAKARQEKSDLNEQFATIHAGALLDLMESVAAGLRHAGEPAQILGRLADFEGFCQRAALEHETYEPNAFVVAYKANQDATTANVLDDDLFVRNLAYSTRNGFKGTPSELLASLPPLTTKLPAGVFYPQTSKSLGHNLMRIAPSLRTLGWQVEPYKGHERGWLIKPPAPKSVEDKVDARLGGYTD